MRSSHSSHRSSSHRSSFSRSHHSSSHRSSISSRRSSFSHSHHSSMSNRNGFGGIRHNSMHRSSIGNMHHSSLSRRTSMGTMMSNRSAFKHHGISDAHAFAVGKATGVNINGSHMGAHGAALHRGRIRKNARFTGKMRANSSAIRRKYHNYSGANLAYKRKIKFSHNNKYKSKRYKFDPNKNNINVQMPEFSKFMWVPILFIIIMMIVMAITSFSFISKVHKIL